MTAENVLVTPTQQDKKAEANEAHRRFAVADGDLPSLISLWEEWQSTARDGTEYRKAWAKDRHVSWRALQRADLVRNQLRDLVAKAPLSMDPSLSAMKDPVSAKPDSKANQQPQTGQAAEDLAVVVVNGMTMSRAPESLLRCLAAGFFLNAASYKSAPPRDSFALAAPAPCRYRTLLTNQEVELAQPKIPKGNAHYPAHLCLSHSHSTG